MTADSAGGASGSGTSAPPPAASATKARAPHKCGKCRNHGLDVLKKGHTKNCPYRNCPCAACSSTQSKVTFESGGAGAGGVVGGAQQGESGAAHSVPAQQGESGAALSVRAVVKLQAGLRRRRAARMKAVEGMKRAELKAYVEQLLKVSPDEIRQKMQAVLDASDKRCNRTCIAAIRVAALPEGEDDGAETELSETTPAPTAPDELSEMTPPPPPPHPIEKPPTSPTTETSKSRTKPSLLEAEHLSDVEHADMLPLPRELFPPDKQAIAAAVPRSSSTQTDSARKQHDVQQKVLWHSRRWPRLRLRVMSWNIRKFTQTDGSERRLHHLTECIAKVMPTVLLIQEVQTGGGGERALHALVQLLAQRTGTKYRCTLSPRVLSDKPSEHHACVWDASVLGEAPPQWEAWREIKERAPLNVEDEDSSLEDEDSSLKAARLVWAQLTSDSAFDRAPAFVHFSNGTTVGSVHHARSPAVKVKAEALALQALLGAAARRGMTVILCGDFNVDEALGGAGRASWVPGACMGDDAPRFGPIRRHFFDEYAPCIPSSYSTNLFPFTEHPQHNDQVWVTRRVFCTPEFVGGVDARPHGDGGTGQSAHAPQAGVSMIPMEVVETVQVDAKARGLNTRSKVFTELSAHLFSDHRPVWADLHLSQ